MLALSFPAGVPLSIVCLGAHSDDIEIGAAGTILRLLRRHPGSTIRWVVFSGSGVRAEEARASVDDLLEGAAAVELTLFDLRESYFPYESGVKDAFELLKAGQQPDVVLTHARSDRHQDHRVVSDLTWNTWRNNVVLEYEIPKYDGDLGSPNLFVPLDPELVARKLDHLDRHFQSQADRLWYDRETFAGLMRLRGVECQAPAGFAEAFHARKLVLD